MKKWIATILSISLVIGMAAMLHACGKPDAEPESTTEPTDVLPVQGDEDTTGENAWADLWGLEDESYTERTTDEHYEEEYNALTLPMAVTTQPAAGTTRAQTTTNPSVRETTTQFMFTTPSRSSTTTTKREEAGTTVAAANESTTASTTKPSTSTTTAPAEEETTMLTDYIGAGGVQQATVQPRPQVTLLDKYVIDIFKSGAFTLEMEMKQEGKTMPITLYEDEDNLAVEMTLTSLVMQDLELPAAFSGIGKVRFVITGKRSSNPRAYIMWPGSYMEMEDAGEVADMIREMQSEGDVNVLSQLTEDGLEYCGRTTGIGYVCESYINPDENMQYNFYFAQTPEGYEGVVRWDRVDLSTGQTDTEIVMRLSQGVKSSKAFKVEGKKTSMEDFENMFGG